MVRALPVILDCQSRASIPAPAQLEPGALMGSKVLFRIPGALHGAPALATHTVIWLCRLAWCLPHLTSIVARCTRLAPML